MRLQVVCYINGVLTSYDAEKLLDPHVNIDTAEELVHVTVPALEESIGWLTRCAIWRGGIVAHLFHLTGKHPAQPSQNLPQPLETQSVNKT